MYHPTAIVHDERGHAHLSAEHLAGCDRCGGALGIGLVPAFQHLRERIDKLEAKLAKLRAPKKGGKR